MQPPGGKPWLLFVLLGASLATNLVMAIWWPRCPTDCGPTRGAAPPPVPAEPALAPAAADAPDAVPEPTAVPAEGVVAAGGYQVFRGTVQENLARTFQTGGVGEKADAVAAVFTRQFVWDLDLRRDMQKGDAVTALYSIDAQAEIDMPLAFLKSAKLGRELKAYRFTAPGDEHPSFWYPDGTEVPHRLVNGPLAQYIQITSLLGDRHSHDGWDLKAPDGTPITSPKAGRVERANWNHASNGNCLDIAQDDGVHALYLHMSRNDVKEGDRVKAGQVIGAVGNTGHSTAPHLHYQIERGGQVVDPGKYHGTTRRKLPAEAMPAFQQEMARLEALLTPPATPVPAPAEAPAVP